MASCIWPGMFVFKMRPSNHYLLNQLHSPFHAKATDPKEVYEPALNGTQSILESIHKYAPSVKRCVVTSSFAAIMKPYSTKLPYTYTEKDFNNESPAKVI